MSIKIYPEIIQGSEEWHQLRCGVLTASAINLIVTPKTLKYASNDKERAHLYEMVAQVITQYVEPQYVSDDMLRGMTDEVEARNLYAQRYAPVEQVGFITNDKYGFVIGYSPDGVVGDDGLIEIKSRRQKYQVQSILDDAMPDEYRIQVQTGLLVTERPWLDYISYSAGLPMMTKRIYADAEIQEAIVLAATEFNKKKEAMLALYAERLRVNAERLIPTERKIEQEMLANA